jgi:FkbM family methyltransferase
LKRQTGLDQGNQRQLLNPSQLRRNGNVPIVQDSAPPQPPGLLRQFINRMTGNGPSGGGAQGLFYLRSEVARLQAAVKGLHSGYGRRDIASVKALIESAYRRDFEAAMRDRIHTVPLPDGTVLCRVLGRYKMYVDAEDTSLAPHLMLEGFWQYWITAFLCRNLDRGETAYDLDAGYGYYALLMSELVDAQGRVVALEYNPWLFQLLRRNLSLNGRDNIVVAHRVIAAGQAAAAKEMPVSLMGPPAVANQAVQFRRDSAASCIAPAMTLDGLEPGAADLVLVSATALEQNALRGMQGLMDRSPSLKIILDFRADRCANPREALDGLAARYPLRFIDHDGHAKPTTVEKILDQGSLSLFLSQIEPR